MRKTIVSAIFMAHALRFGSASYHKPIQTVIESDCDASTVRSLLAPYAQVNADYGLGLLRPLAPFWSAHYQNVAIDFNEVVKKAKLAFTADITIIEGFGGCVHGLSQRRSANGFFLLMLCELLTVYW